MSAEEAVVPIAPGLRVEGERGRQLLDHVAQALASFPQRNDGEQPVSIVVTIVGEAGTAKVDYLIAERWRSTCALASVLLAAEATGEKDE
jgi:hypothetical protein